MIRPSDIQDFARSIYGARRYILTPYAYPIIVGQVAASGTATASLSITANADFIFTRLRYKGYSTSTGAAVNVSTALIPNVSVLITDQGSNEQYSSAAVPISSYGSNSQGIEDLPFPRFIAGRTALTFQVINNDSANILYQLSLVMEGVLARQLSD